MNLSDYLESIGPKVAIAEAKEHAAATGVKWDGGIIAAFEEIAHNPSKAPKKVKETKNDKSPLIFKWIKEYIKMNLSEYLEGLEPKAAIAEAKEHAAAAGIKWDAGIHAVFSGIAHNPGIAPSKVKETKSDKSPLILKWIRKYANGYAGRASQRVSNPPGTTADPIIDSIIVGRITHLDEDDLENIKYAHRLGMSAENILGQILEEYLAQNIAVSGWHCAWGETAKSIDFIKDNGEMLQVKNRSNSENSSSVRVREGTEIQKWHRVDAKTGAYQWGVLNTMCGIKSLSEENFVSFVKDLLAKNPGAMAVEADNTWLEEE